MLWELMHIVAIYSVAVSALHGAYGATHIFAQMIMVLKMDMSLICIWRDMNTVFPLRCAIICMMWMVLMMLWDALGRHLISQYGQSFLSPVGKKATRYLLSSSKITSIILLNQFVLQDLVCILQCQSQWMNEIWDAGRGFLFCHSLSHTRLVATPTLADSPTQLVFNFGLVRKEKTKESKSASPFIPLSS